VPCLTSLLTALLKTTPLVLMLKVLTMSDSFMCCSLSHLPPVPPFFSSSPSLSLLPLPFGAPYPCLSSPLSQSRHLLPSPRFGCVRAVAVFCDTLTLISLSVLYPCGSISPSSTFSLPSGMNILCFCWDNFLHGSLIVSHSLSNPFFIRLPNPFEGGSYFFCNSWSQCNSYCVSSHLNYPISRFPSPSHCMYFPLPSSPPTLLSLSRFASGEIRLVEDIPTSCVPSCLSIVRYYFVQFSPILPTL